MAVPLIAVFASLLALLPAQALFPVDPLWWVLRNTLLAAIAGAGLALYVFLQQQWRERQAAEADRRLDALQARIAPHFLFNTLNTLTELVHDKPAEAEQAMLDMADLLRTALRGASSHTLEDELELVRGYLRIEALRLGERLQVEWSLPDELPGELALPALVIQPLVENAILHGIARCSEPGALRIQAERRRFGRWRFVIENPMPADRSPSAEGSLALDNIRQRLALAYDDEADLRLHSDKHVFRAELTLPDRREP
ncbi:MAG: sensor histidine kinase [Wenzhouxiangella sp.]